MDWAPASAVRWLLDSEHGASDRLIPRWLFLRALGLIYFSAFLLADLSDSRAYRSRGNPPGKRLSAGGSAFVWPRPLLVCANTCCGFQADSQMLVGSLLGRDGGIAAAGFECVAARSAGSLLRMFSFLRQCSRRLLWLPVRRHVAGSRIHRAFLCSAGISPGLGCGAAAFSRQLVSPAVGVVSHLLRVRRSSRLRAANPNGVK